MTPGRLVYLVRRDLQRGLGAAWHDRLVAPRILQWRNAWVNLEAEPVPVCVLTGAEQFRMTLWMLASWFDFTERNWRVVVHDDGTLTEEEEGQLTLCLPEARFIRAEEADQRVRQELGEYSRCWSYRERHPLARKIFDVPLMVSTDRFILLDSDVLFYGKPLEMLAWVDGKTVGCWFNEDVAEASPVSKEEAKEVLHIDLWSRVNSGICLLEKEAIEVDFCERVLAETSLTHGHPWRIEQTLYALCASRHGKGGLLPGTYEVSLHTCRRSDGVARHYVGAVRDRFYAEGVRELKGRLIKKS